MLRQLDVPRDSRTGGDTRSYREISLSLCHPTYPTTTQKGENIWKIKWTSIMTRIWGYRATAPTSMWFPCLLPNQATSNREGKEELGQPSHLAYLSMDLRSMRGWHHRYHPATTQGYHFCVGQCDNGCEKGYTADAKAMMQEKNLTAEKENTAEKPSQKRAEHTRRKRLSPSSMLPKGRLNLKLSLEMTCQTPKKKVRYSSLCQPCPKSIFQMQTAEAQATTSNAVQSEDDRQQIRRITVKL